MRRKISRYMLYAVALIIALLLIIMNFVYNKMIDEKHFLDTSYGNLQAELQKREDLNINAIEAVSVYVKAEDELMNWLITLAGGLKTGANAVRIKAGREEIERLVNTMDVLVMMFPGLKAKGPYLYLMETFRATENGVLAGRLHYNTAVCEYDLFLDKFPYCVIAWFYGFKRAQIFSAGEGTWNVPDIDGRGTKTTRRIPQ